MKTIKMVADELNVTKQTVVNNAKNLNISFEKENGVNYIDDNDYLKIVEKITKKERTTQNKENKKSEDEEEVPMPTKEIATASISGIDVMDIEDAQKTLWKEEIYAEGGMGCTGPVIKVNDKNYDKSVEILKEKGFVS